MQELQVPTRRIEVEIATDAGDHVGGALFIPDSASPEVNAGEIADVLNDERRFIPFLAESPAWGRTVLNKARVVSVRITDETGLDTDDVPTDPGEACTLQLSNGSDLVGTIRLPTPGSASRLLDKLNQADHFFTVVNTDGVCFVRRGHVVRAT